MEKVLFKGFDPANLLLTRSNNPSMLDLQVWHLSSLEN